MFNETGAALVSNNASNLVRNPSHYLISNNKKVDQHAKVGAMEDDFHEWSSTWISIICSSFSNIWKGKGICLIFLRFCCLCLLHCISIFIVTLHVVQVRSLIDKQYHVATLLLNVIIIINNSFLQIYLLSLKCDS